MTMTRAVTVASGAICAVGLIVLGLWGWQRAGLIVTLMGWEKRTVGAWSARCAGLALISAAEAILLTLVVERLYRPDAVCGAALLSALMVFLVCAVCAIALGCAGR